MIIVGGDEPSTEGSDKMNRETDICVQSGTKRAGCSLSALSVTSSMRNENNDLMTLLFVWLVIITSFVFDGKLIR